MCIGINDGNALLYSLDESRNIIHRQIFRCPAEHYQYNHDGSCIIAYGGQKYGIKIITPPAEDNPCSDAFNTIRATGGPLNFCGACGIRIENTTGYPHESIVKPMFHDNNASIQKIIFYPQSSIIAMLQRRWNENKDGSYFIKYAYIQTQKYMHTSPKLPFIDSLDDSYDLSFSPDTTKLLVTCNGKSIIVPVPWQINKPYYLYLLLQHYRLDQEALCHDIIWLLTTTLHDVCGHIA